MTEDLNKRVIELMTDLFNKAAEQSACADAIGDAVTDAVDDAISDKIGYSEVITADSFNDYLEDSDVLSQFAREDYVDEAVQYAVDELESEIICADRVRDMIAETTVTLDVVNQMLSDLETDFNAALEEAKLSNRIKSSVGTLFTLTKAKLRSLASMRLTLRKD